MGATSSMLLSLLSTMAEESPEHWSVIGEYPTSYSGQGADRDGAQLHLYLSPGLATVIAVIDSAVVGAGIHPSRVAGVPIYTHYHVIVPTDSIDSLPIASPIGGAKQLRIQPPGIL